MQQAVLLVQKSTGSFSRSPLYRRLEVSQVNRRFNAARNRCNCGPQLFSGERRLSQYGVALERHLSQWCVRKDYVWSAAASDAHMPIQLEADTRRAHRCLNSAAMATVSTPKCPPRNPSSSSVLASLE